MNKANEGDGIPVELFQILKEYAVKVLHSICQQTWKTQQWPQDWKRSVFIPIPKKGNAKECSICHMIALISICLLASNAQNSPSLASTVCELRNSKYSSWFQKRQRNQRSNCQHPLDHQKGKRIPEKHLLLLYRLHLSLVWICKQTVLWTTTNCGKFLKRWGYKITLPVC